MRRPNLLRGVVFALIAGLGVMFWLLLAGPIFGYARAAALYGLALLPWYSLAVAPAWRAGLIAFFLAAVLAMPAALFAAGPRLVFALTPFVLGIVRSAILFPRPFPRALFLELCCSVPALLLAAFFHDSSVIGMTLAFWAFWLVQSGFALAPGEPGETSVRESGDAFEVAHARALAVLERSQRDARPSAVK
jgi:hypothetical protein